MSTDFATGHAPVVPPGPAAALVQRLGEEVDAWSHILAIVTSAEQRAPSGWSAVEHAVRVCDLWRARAEQIDAMRRDRRPLLDRALIDAPHARVAGIATVGTRLAIEADHLGRVGAAVPASDWDRTDLRPGQPVTVAALFGECLTESNRRLAAAGRLAEQQQT